MRLSAAWITLCFIFFAWTVFAIGSSGAEARHGPVLLDLDDGGYSSLHDNLHVLRDPSGQLNVDDILGRLLAGDMARPDGPYLNFLPTTGRYWVAFSLRNSGTQRIERIIDLRRPHLLALDVYVVRGNATEHIVRLDDRSAVSDRPFQARYHGFPIFLAPGETLRIVVGYRSFATGWISPRVGTRNAVLAAHAVEDTLNWTINGFLLAMMVFTGILLPLVGLSLALSHVAYAFTGFVFIVHAEGYLHRFLWPNTAVPADYVAFLLALLVTLAALNFARILFGTRMTQPKSDRLYIRVAFLLVAALPMSACFYGLAWFNAATYLLVVGTSLLHPFIGIVALRQRQLGAGAFLVGSPLIVGSLFFSALAHLAPGWFSVEATLDVGHVTLLVEAFAFAVAILARVVGLRRERDKATQNELRAARARLLLDGALRQSEERARETSQRLATLGHDIRQPLLGLRSAMSRLEGAPKETAEKLRHVFDYMEMLARHDLEQSDNEARPKQDAVKSPVETVAIDTVLTNAVEMFRTEAAEKSIDLVYHPEDIDVAVRPVLLMRMINNLISNAVRHTRNGRVVVAIEHSDDFPQDRITIIVSDTGQGMTRDELADYRRYGRRGEASSGDGLGLGIVEDLARAEDIIFRLGSVKGKGTIAQLTLPEWSYPGRPKRKTSKASAE